MQKVTKYSKINPTVLLWSDLNGLFEERNWIWHLCHFHDFGDFHDLRSFHDTGSLFSCRLLNWINTQRVYGNELRASVDKRFICTFVTNANYLPSRSPDSE